MAEKSLWHRSITGHSRRLVGGLLLTVLFVSLMAAHGSAQAGEAPASVQLGDGHIGRYLWASRIEAPEDESEQSQGVICLAIAFFEPTSAYTGEGSDVAQCDPLVDSVPMIEAFTGGKPGKRRTAVAILFDGRATRLYLKLRGEKGRTVRLRRLSEEELAPITSASLSYFTHGYAGQVCVQRLVAYGAAGGVIARSGRRACLK